MTEKRKRGRPKGSKNRPKAINPVRFPTAGDMILNQKPPRPISRAARSIEHLMADMEK